MCINFGIIKSNTMPAPVLILTTGAPCTGKTTIAQHLAGKFQLPVVHKDDIKERLFNRLGWKTDHWKLADSSWRSTQPTLPAWTTAEWRLPWREFWINP